MNKVILSQISVEELTKVIAEKLLIQLKERDFSPSSKEEKKEFLTALEVAEMCNVKALSTLWNWRKQGLLIPEAQAGRKPLYKYQDVINFLEGKKGGSYGTV
ncbi:unnamed protein product [Ectocarpus sp. 12 AP-2014]